MKREIFATVLLFSLWLPLTIEPVQAQPTWYLETSGTTSQLSGVDFLADLGWVVGASGTIRRTYNGGKTWYAQSSGTTSYLYSLDMRSIGSTTKGWAVGAGGVIRHSPTGSSWTAQTSGTTANLYAVRFAADLQHGWIVGDAGTFLRTINGGASWTKITVKYPFLWTTRTVTEPLRGLDFVTNDLGWAVGTTWVIGSDKYAMIIRTTDSGSNWQYQGMNVPADGRVTLNYVDFVDSNNGWAVGYSGVILRTSDGGAHWTKQNSGTTKTLNAVRFLNTNVGWVVGDGGLILHTTNGGTIWTAQTSGTTRNFYDVDAADSEHAWAVGQLGTIDRYAPFDFSLTRTPPTRTVAKGASTTFTIYVNRVAGAPKPVLLSTTGLPTGTSVSFSTNNVNTDYTSTMSVTTTAATPTGSFTITIHGVSGALTRTATATLTVTAAPDFNLQVTPPSLEVNAGASGSVTVTISSLLGFSSAVTLSAIGLPSDVTAAFSVNPATPPAGGTVTSTLNLNVGSGAATGTYTITVQGTSGAISRSDTFDLVISSPPPPPETFDFALAVAGSASVSIAPGGTATYELQVNLVSGTTQVVSLSASGLPTGATASFTTQSATPTYTTTLSIATSPASPLGSYSLIVSATGGGVTHQQVLTLELVSPATLTITTVTTPTTTPTTTTPIVTTPTTTTPTTTVTPTTTTPTTTTTTPTTPTGRCLIATATYESELAPEVQFLRNFRDARILKTYAGTQFMSAFNAFYYSFSPTVAAWIQRSPAVMTASKALLYPLIGSLEMASQAYECLAFNMEVAAVGAGLVASTLIGAIYLSPIFALTARIRGLRSRRILLTLAPILLLSLGLIAAAEILYLPYLMMIGTVSLVLSAMCISGLTTSRTIASLIAIIRNRI